ncbi:MAG: dicarboxylate/amino acid:cation symporter [Phycisphaeraceae bacterium]
MADNERRNLTTPPAWAFWHWRLHWQILLGMVIGAGIGYLLGLWAVKQLPADVPAAQAGLQAMQTVRASGWFIFFQLVGDLFMRGLQLIIVPLVVSSIVLAVVNMGAGQGLGRLGAKTLAYYACTSLIAILIGLLLVNLVSPGTDSQGLGILENRDLSAFEGDQRAVEARAGGRTASDFLNVFRQMVPPNPVAAAAEGQLLGLIVVSLVSGFFLARLGGEPQRVMVSLTQGIYDITMKITDVVLALAPIGVLGLLVATVAEQYAKLAPDARFAQFLTGIAQFAGVVFVALALHFVVSMSLILLLVARVKPWRHYKAMAPALITAFSTASSNATLPLTMECVEERAGVSRKTASFVLPLGATVNMDGTALYECVAAIFICQAFGVELTLGQQFMIVITALLTSIGVAGVPAASLVAIIVILQAVQAQLPPEAPALILGMGLLFVFDRPLDMCRTAVNIFSDSVGAVVVARTEGETSVLTGDSEQPATT